jgi:hypothetical protein
VSEIVVLVYYRVEIGGWFSHNLWVVVIPFLKVLLKRLLALSLVAVFKASIVLFWNLSKLFLLKLIKTLSLRYGVYFSQSRWRWIRYAKLMFLRRGKQFFHKTQRFWGHYNYNQKRVVLIAFFPAVVVLFLLGLSFNITRKTMVQKTQESAIFQAATSAGNANRGIRAWIKRLDKKTLQKIRDLRPPKETDTHSDKK